MPLLISVDEFMKSINSVDEKLEELIRDIKKVLEVVNVNNEIPHPIFFEIKDGLMSISYEGDHDINYEFVCECFGMERKIVRSKVYGFKTTIFLKRMPDCKIGSKLHIGRVI